MLRQYERIHFQGRTRRHEQPDKRQSRLSTHCDGKQALSLSESHVPRPNCGMAPIVDGSAGMPTVGEDTVVGSSR